ncbi:MAG: putative HTH transcriptional regulator, partial [Candidatus Endobugula sp.]
MDYKQLLQQPEGRRLEFKASLPSKSDLSKTIIAFANDAGGVLLIGVKESPREISGLPES